ncbi:pilus assembly protein TadG-related protein [Novosphingobium sp.]|uniref:pilus assembly protein TadG-related protein n=1 Tax=Novosphingobium sp. TaxID=1874826 RepID=UPI002601749E|nr:pilus assembly protein TadG-related protein [Novosphingobium sp.]
MIQRLSPSRMIAPLNRRARELAKDNSANVLMLTGGGIMMLMLAIGFGVDYARAVQTRTELNAAADAAALVSVDPSMFNQSDATAVASAKALFNARVAGIPGVTITSLDVTAPTTTSSVASTSRTATVTWSATVNTMFAGILGKDTFTIGGKAVSNAAQPPNINFYVMLDNSPSMLLPTTSAGINALQSVSPNNCAFSCHVNRVWYGDIKDSAGNVIILANDYYDIGINQSAGVYRYNASTKRVFDANNTLIGTGASVGSGYYWLKYKNTNNVNVTVNTVPADPFWLAQNYGKAYGSPAKIEMRIDAELEAAQDLINTAKLTASQLSSASQTVTYRMQFFTMNYEAYPLTSSLDNVNSLNPSVLVPSNGTLTPYILQGGYHPTNSNPKVAPGVWTNYSDSSPFAVLGQMNTAMPDPGTGAPNSTPQQVLLIVTDGYQDELVNGSQIRQAWNSQTLARCTAIKNRGIRIAILYTVYDPATISSHYPAYAAKTTSIAPTLKSCASTTSGGASLMYSVAADQDISAALSNLFAMTVQTAHLVQ